MRKLYIATDLKISHVSSTRKIGVISHLRNFFSWTTMVKAYNKLPAGMCECKSKRDAQLYTAVLCVVFGCCVPPLLFVGFGLIFKR